MTADGLPVNPQHHSDMGGVAEAGQDLRELGLAELTRHEFADVFILVRVRVEICPIRRDSFVDGHQWA
jgi:hypothetical protein